MPPFREGVAFFKIAVSTRDLFALLVTLIVAFYASVILAIPLNSRMAEVALARFHLDMGFSQWASLHLMPAMYNFENEIRVTKKTEPGQTSLAREEFWYNHHPVGATLAHQARRLPNDHQSCFVFLYRSRYQGTELRSSYEVCPGPDGRSSTVVKLPIPQSAPNP